MTFHENPPRTDDEDLGPTGTDALEYRIDKLLRENQALAERLVRAMLIEEAAKAVVRSAMSSLCCTERHWYLDHVPSKNIRALSASLSELSTNQDNAPRDLLRAAVKLAMGPDPHNGGEPHPDTVDAITDGVLARIAVNNARPAKYSDEPWREQTVEYHAEHADSHITRAWLSIHNEPGYTWLSDLGQPEAAHAGLRIDFLLWRHGKDEKK